MIIAITPGPPICHHASRREHNRAAAKSDHQVLSEQNQRRADPAHDAVDLPAAPDKQRPQPMHDRRQHGVERVLTIRARFQLARSMTCIVSASSKQPGEPRQRQHQRERQRHGPIENDDRHDVDMRVVHPLERRNEELDDLREENQDEQNERKRSFPPRHHEHVLKLRQVDRGREPRLPVQFAHLVFRHGADQQTGGKNTTHARGVDFLARAAGWPASKENSGRATESTAPSTRSPETIPCSRRALHVRGHAAVFVRYHQHHRDAVARPSSFCRRGRLPSRPACRP